MRTLAFILASATTAAAYSAAAPPAPPNTRKLEEEIPAPVEVESVPEPPPVPREEVPAAPRRTEDDETRERKEMIREMTKTMSYPPREGAWIYGGLGHCEECTTVAACAESCEDTPNCLHYTWQLGNDACTLHQEGGGEDDSKIGFLVGHSKRWRARKTEL